MKLIDKLISIEVQDRRILSTRSKGKAPFYIPGGNREAGETYCQTTFRKIEEKLAVQLAPAMLRFVGNFQAHGQRPRQGAGARPDYPQLAETTRPD
ncbi:hypothetical protein GCM10023188_47250 [Pontibacter saemangeumensis]|uniref:NUDIX domain-containing protein n=1 Tax=Pontibacter saemangeumensis TaxID=1084525 RepID=A0ABP8M6T2_9BACT